MIDYYFFEGSWVIFLKYFYIVKIVKKNLYNESYREKK